MVISIMNKQFTECIKGVRSRVNLKIKKCIHKVHI